MIIIMKPYERMKIQTLDKSHKSVKLISLRIDKDGELQEKEEIPTT